MGEKSKAKGKNNQTQNSLLRGKRIQALMEENRLSKIKSLPTPRGNGAVTKKRLGNSRSV